MAILWVGDFRLNQLQNYQNKIKNAGINSIFLTDDNAEYNWLKGVITDQIPQMTLESADVVIMSGFNDCVYSCNWDDFAINNIADKYIKLFDDLEEEYTGVKFYFCTVCPIDAAYPFAYHGDADIIAQEDLENKIIKFNNRIKDKCKATIIDCYKYLTETGFNTRDGGRFDLDTCGNLQNFIMSHLPPTSTSCFMSRVRASLEDAPKPYIDVSVSDPEVGADSVVVQNADDSFAYWVSAATSAPEEDSNAFILGLNACTENRGSKADPKTKKKYHTVLPSNIGYVHGRFMEIMGVKIPNPEDEKDKDNTNTGTDDPNTQPAALTTLPTSDALADWWGDKATHTYRQGPDPQLGAIICWKNSAGKIEVAIVEYINKKTNSITVSRSYNATAEYDPTNVEHFNTLIIPCAKTTGEGADGKDTEIKKWETGSLKFLGFLYATASVCMSANRDGLCTDNSYGIALEQMQPNAQYIWQYFGSKGWPLNAVAGMLGNMQEESKLSPQIWESTTQFTDKPVTIHADGSQTVNKSEVDKIGRGLGRSPIEHIGYGLTQWTPYTKLMTWCKNGGTSGNANGTGGILPFWDIDTQLKRIEAEVEQSEKSWIEGLSQWKKKESIGYDLTFKEYISSTKDAAWLAGAFAFCYERPARSTGTIAQQNALRKERGEYASYWYNYLSGAAPLSFTAGLPSCTGVESVFIVTNFKVDKCLPTQVFASFIAVNGATGTYRLKKDDKLVAEDKLEIGKDGIATFDVDNLLPNTLYSIELDVTGKTAAEIAAESAKDAGEEVIEATQETTETEEEPRESKDNIIYFKTPQDYPKPIQYINLTCEDEVKTPKSTFSLSVIKPDYLGYWKKNSSGYDKLLFVNGKCVKTNTVSRTDTSISEKFTLENEFGYTCRTGDCIQIGIRTWVKDDSGNKLYDSDNAVVSGSICILNKSIIPHIRVKTN